MWDIRDKRRSLLNYYKIWKGIIRLEGDNYFKCLWECGLGAFHGFNGIFGYFSICIPSWIVFKWAFKTYVFAYKTKEIADLHKYLKPVILCINLEIRRWLIKKVILKLLTSYAFFLINIQKKIQKKILMPLDNFTDTPKKEAIF